MAPSWQGTTHLPSQREALERRGEDERQSTKGELGDENASHSGHASADDTGSSPGSGGGIGDPSGNPLYVIIEVTWDGNPAHAGSGTVWGPMWDPKVGTGNILASCPGGRSPSSCLDLFGYQFNLSGKTLQFDEPYPGVDASPPVRHVVLTDVDGDGVYTRSLAAEKYNQAGTPPAGNLYHDQIDYEVTVDSSGQVTNFHYLEYEHKKLK